MARTANAARKQVTKAPASQGGGKDSSQGGNTSKEFQPPAKRPAKSLSVSVPTISQMPKPTPKRVSRNIMKEIKYYQSNPGFLVPRALVIRIVRQALLSVMRSKAGEPLKFTAVALNVIHESIENYIVCLMELAYMAARHAKRVTLFPTDIRLINRIRGASAQ